MYGTTPNPYSTFISFVDSNWAMSRNCKSVSRYIIKCGDGPLTWSSKQQVIVALSSCEAKYLICSTMPNRSCGSVPFSMNLVVLKTIPLHSIAITKALSCALMTLSPILIWNKLASKPTSFMMLSIANLLVSTTSLVSKTLLTCLQNHYSKLYTSNGSNILNFMKTYHSTKMFNLLWLVVDHRGVIWFDPTPRHHGWQGVHIPYKWYAPLC